MRVRLQEGIIRAACAQHVRHQDVGDGELVRCDERAVRKPSIELLKSHVRPLLQCIVRLGPFAAADADEPRRQHGDLDRAQRGDTPAQDLRFPREVDLEGTQQSGIAFDLKIADIVRDGQLLQYVRAIAESIVEQDPAAQSPENEILWRQLKALRKTNVNWAAIS